MRQAVIFLVVRGELHSRMPSRRRTITASRKTSAGEKRHTFTISDDAKIVVGGKDSDLDNLAKGDVVTLTYDQAADRVVKIEGDAESPEKAPPSDDDSARKTTANGSAAAKKATPKRTAPPKPDAKFFRNKFAGKPVYTRRPAN